MLNRGTAAIAISSLDVSAKKITRDLCIAEAANHHLTAVGPKLSAQIKSLLSDHPLKRIRDEPSARIEFHPVGNSQVLQILRNLKPGKVTGSNNDPTKLVKMP